jgi:hypothetical protein
MWNLIDNAIMHFLLNVVTAFIRGFIFTTHADTVKIFIKFCKLEGLNKNSIVTVSPYDCQEDLKQFNGQYYRYAKATDVFNKHLVFVLIMPMFYFLWCYCLYYNILNFFKLELLAIDWLCFLYEAIYAILGTIGGLCHINEKQIDYDLKILNPDE